MSPLRHSQVSKRGEYTTVSLQHNLKILTKNPARPQDKELNAQKLATRVRPIPDMIPIPGTNTRYRYLYEKNRYEPGIGCFAI